MSYATALRRRLEQLLTGDTGTTRTLAPGRFHLRDPAVPLEQQAADHAERAVEVVLSPGRVVDGYNTLDSPALWEHTATVRIAYLRTGAGGDAGETVAEESGPGTLDGVRDRALTDAFDVTTTLCWHENRAGTDPTLVAIGPLPAGPTLTDAGVLTLLEIPLLVTVSVTTPGSYAP